MRTRTLFISDLHMTHANLYERGFAWFDPGWHLSRVLATLEREVCERADQIAHLVLLGDTFDTWQTPMNERPGTYATMLEDNPEFVDSIARVLAHGVDVTFVRGNHDADLDAETIARALPGARVADEVRTVYAHAEHGHEHTMFNAQEHCAWRDLSAGYFLGRIGEDRLPGGRSLRALAAYVRHGALNGVFHQDFVGRVFDVIYAIAGVDPREEYVLEDGTSITAGEVRERYEDAAGDMTLGERVWRLTQDMNGLRGAAARRAISRERPVVVFGHTHNAHLGKVKGGTIYANSGAWCQRDAHVIEIDEGESPSLMLRRVTNEGRLETVRQQAIAPGSTR